jgi:hypothetical protein
MLAMNANRIMNIAKPNVNMPNRGFSAVASGARHVRKRETAAYAAIAMSNAPTASMPLVTVQYTVALVVGEMIWVGPCSGVY